MTPARKRSLIAVAVLVMLIWALTATSSSKPKQTHTSPTIAEQPTGAAADQTAVASDTLDDGHRYCAQLVLPNVGDPSRQPPLACFATSAAAFAAATGNPAYLGASDARIADADGRNGAAAQQRSLAASSTCVGCQPRWLLGIDYRDTHNQGDQLYWYATSSCAGHRFLAEVPASWINRISSASPAPASNTPSDQRCGHWIHYAAKSSPAGLSTAAGRQLARSTVNLDCGYLSNRSARPPCYNLDLPGGGSLNDRTAIEEWH